MPTAGLLPALDENPHAPFVFIDGHLGLPQKALYQAYLLACRAFRAARQASDFAALLRASSVLLLANPAHSTALNARKRLVTSGQRDARQELDFTAVLLSEQQACKSSLLWHHRRWLLRQLHSTHPDISVDGLDSCVVPIAELRVELALTAQACEAYRRNYFAWNHRLHCARNFRPHGVNGHDNVVELVDGELATVHGWIDRHVSDHTAMHYACELVTVYEDVSGSPARMQRTLQHAVSAVAAFPNHEALWCYLRRICCMLSRRSEANVQADERLERLLYQLGVRMDDPGDIEFSPNARPWVDPDEQGFATRCMQWLKVQKNFPVHDVTSV